MLILEKWLITCRVAFQPMLVIRFTLKWKIILFYQIQAILSQCFTQISRCIYSFCSAIDTLISHQDSRFDGKSSGPRTHLLSVCSYIVCLLCVVVSVPRKIFSCKGFEYCKFEPAVFQTEKHSRLKIKSLEIVNLKIFLMHMDGCMDGSWLKLFTKLLLEGENHTFPPLKSYKQIKQVNQCSMKLSQHNDTQAALLIPCLSLQNKLAVKHHLPPLQGLPTA